METASPSDPIIQLSTLEARVLGALMEKERTTPEYYPLTINSLLAACNQKSNRAPLMSLSDEDVEEGIEALRAKRIVFRVDVAGSRVPKFRHALRDIFPVDLQGEALLCTLLLRGPQTPGELRGRSERIAPFPSIDDVHETLESLREDYDQPLVVELPRQPGRKEARFAHTFCEITETAPEENSGPVRVEIAERVTREEADALAARVETLEAEVARLTADLRNLRESLGEA